MAVVVHRWDTSSRERPVEPALGAVASGRADSPPVFAVHVWAHETDGGSLERPAALMLGGASGDGDWQRGERVDARGRSFNVFSLHHALIQLLHSRRLRDVDAMLDDECVLEASGGSHCAGEVGTFAGRRAVLAQLSREVEDAHGGRIASVEPIALSAFGETHTLWRSAGAVAAPPPPTNRPRQRSSPAQHAPRVAASAAANPPPFRIAERIEWSPDGRARRIRRREPAALSQLEWSRAIAAAHSRVAIAEHLAEGVTYMQPGGRVLRGRADVLDALGALSARLHGHVRSRSAPLELGAGGGGGGRASQLELCGDWLPIGARPGARGVRARVRMLETLTWAPSGHVREITHALIPRSAPAALPCAPSARAAAAAAGSSDKDETVAHAAARRMSGTSAGGRGVRAQRRGLARRRCG